jgi:leucyl-tRNA synthetase
VGGFVLVLPAVHRPHNDEAPWSKEKERYWMPVDLYVGGAEHAVLAPALRALLAQGPLRPRLVSTKEPFQRLVNQGMILGEDGQKMSKSVGNVVNPDDVIERSTAPTRCACTRCSWARSRP